MSDTSIPEDDTVTDDVSTPATEDSETPELATDRRFAFLSRHIAGFRALRLGGVFTVAAAIVVAIVWWVQLTLLWGVAFPYFLFALAILFLWFIGAQLKPLKRTFAAITAACTIVAIGVMGQQWWLIHEQTSIWIGLPLVQALATCGLGVFVVSDVVLRGIRTHQNTPPGDPDDPARYRPMKHNTPHASRRWTGLLRRSALTVAPVTATATAIALLQASAAPINQTAPLPEGPLPERSTGIGTTLTWTRDVPGLLATTSGAAGPVILTPEGLTGLNPTDGTTLWTYHRKNAEYASDISDPYLVSSPNGRYVALRIKIPKEIMLIHTRFIIGLNGEYIPPTYDAVTVVVDTLTGRVTNEHPSANGSNLQLTDSALLDGGTAYNLDDGRIRWRLKPLADDSESHLITGYSGPAGHRSFIRFGKFSKKRSFHNEEPKCRSESLILISDSDPNDTTTAENIANDILTCNPVIIGGRTAQYTRTPAIEMDGEKKKEGSIQAQETRVVTLDSLAGLDEAEPIDMGKTAGLNAAASHASGTLAAYPIPEDGKIKFYGESITGFDQGKPTVGTVFDPTTHTTIPASQYPGLAAATVSIPLTTQDEKLPAEIVMKPGDGSTGASIPLDSRTMLQFPEYMSSSFTPSQLSERTAKEVVNVINTPGLTLVTLKIDGQGRSEWYSSHSSRKKNGEKGYIHVPSYRLYGLTRDAS